MNYLNYTNIDDFIKQAEEIVNIKNKIKIHCSLYHMNKSNIVNAMIDEIDFSYHVGMQDTVQGFKVLFSIDPVEIELPVQIYSDDMKDEDGLWVTKQEVWKIKLDNNNVEINTVAATIQDEVIAADISLIVSKIDDDTYETKAILYFN